MKTQYAILIGLSLIAAAIYFNDTAVKPAYASSKPATKSDEDYAIADCLIEATIDSSYFYTNC